jgi:hypothetical protein
MSPQTEKTIPDGEQRNLTPTLHNTLAPDDQEIEDEIPRKRINGGLDAWLGVLAGFCVFVNSW